MAGLYLHIPFCRRKCCYCDFFSVTATDPLVAAYPELLIRHLAWAAEQGWAGPFDTVYFGGGTPSLLAPDAIAKILNSANRKFGLADHAEITLEANPGTVTQQSLAGFRSAGINRLSFGLQSCNDKQLINLGRLHNRQEGIDAVRWARKAGFDNLSLDLMFALPRQTTSELGADLRSYLELAPEHLSCYGLTPEPQTPLQNSIARGELSLPDEEFYADAFMRIHERLAAAGYEHYEIANYAREGYASRHNQGYWQRSSCLGLGAGAHSFQELRWGSRWQVPADLAAYHKALHAHREPMVCLETFDRESALSETVYLALRTRRGISDDELRQRFGCSLEEAFPEAVASSAQWLKNDQGHWSLTPPAWLLFDHLILPFLAE